MARGRLIKIFGISGILFLLLISQANAETTFELSLGMDSPTQSLNEYWRVGLGLSGGIFLEITPFTSAGLVVGYSNMSLDKEHVLDRIEAPADYTLEEGDFSLVSVCAELRLHAGAMEKAVYFGGIGGGLFAANMSGIKDHLGNDVTMAFDWENKIGGYVHVGFAYPVTEKINIGLKGKYSLFSAGGDTGFANLNEIRQFLSFQALATIKIM